MKNKLNIALIAGGKKCRELLERFEKHAFQELAPSIVAVVDLGEDDSPGPAAAKAEESGIFVTRDVRKILGRRDIDLIIDLTHDKDISRVVLEEKGEEVRFLDDGGAELLWESLVMGGLLEKAREELATTKTLI